MSGPYKFIAVLEEIKGIIEEEFYDLYSHNTILFIKLRKLVLDTDAAHRRKVGGRTNLWEETTLWK